MRDAEIGRIGRIRRTRPSRITDYWGMTNPRQPTSILDSGGAREQALLPGRTAIKMCLRSIRTRLGRSLITLSGVGLGIAFLMSVLATFHIRDAMQDQAATKRDIDLRVAVVRANVGNLQGRPFRIVLDRPIPVDIGFIAALTDRGAQVQLLTDQPLPGGTEAAGAEVPDRAVFLVLGDANRLLSRLGEVAGREVFMFVEPSPAIRAALLGATLVRLQIALGPAELERLAARQHNARARMTWIVAVTLLITVGCIANAMLMSVTERFREIATMKCLGALSSFVIKLFLIESALIGLIGAVIGVAVGVVFPLIAYGNAYAFSQVISTVDPKILVTYGCACIITGIILAVIAAIYPARMAARMVPAAALASNV